MGEQIEKWRRGLRVDKYLGKVENADLVENTMSEFEKAGWERGRGRYKRRESGREAAQCLSEFLKIGFTLFHKDQQNNILFLDLDDKIPSSPLLIT